MADNPQVPKKKKRRKLDVWNRIAVVVLSLFLAVCITVFFVLVNIINDPQGARFSQEGLSTISNSRIYDSGGELIYEFGTEIREDVTYEELPQHVVDAFLSIEDSRYFTHNGFDLPRFMAAAIHNLKSGDFSQGGSTLTMQMIDNVFTRNQESKIEAEKGTVSKLDSVKLKIQEIYLSLIAEQSINKEDIFEYYVNRIWFGSGNNTRGIQKAAQYFFGKDAKNLNLSEAAFLAGAINSPYFNNPFNNLYDDRYDFLEMATKRRNTTLRLMVQHGYITQEEYDLAVNSDLAFDLVQQEQAAEDDVDPNDAYIQQAITECIELTGQDPFNVPMDIYTALNQDVQAQADGICRGTITGNESTSWYWPNDGYNVGIGIIDNDTGEIIAVGPGRYYHSEIVKHDLSITPRQTGSTMKPLLAYAPAFDILGWSTNHTVVDSAKDYFHTGTALRNSDGSYNGAMSLQQALNVSKNTTAAATMVELVNDLGYDYWKDYCKKLGYSKDVADAFVEMYVIGGANMTASPVEQASAYSNFANKGDRINAHRIRKVIRRSDKEEISGDKREYEIVSEQAAFMISTMLAKVAQYSGGLSYYLTGGGYPIYAKSGTTDWDASGLQYGIPNGVMRDSWSCAYTSDYSISTWSGYTTEYEAQGYYINMNTLLASVPFKINRYLMDYLQKYGDYHEIERPDDVSDYGGGYIKSDFLEQGDKYSGSNAQNACTAAGGTWDDENNLCITQTEEDTNKKACEASNGTWDNGACSCPDGYILNNNACEAAGNDEPDEPVDPAERCESWGGTWDGTTCTFTNDDSNQNQGSDNNGENQQQNDNTGYIFPYFRRLGSFLGFLDPNRNQF